MPQLDPHNIINMLREMQDDLGIAIKEIRRRKDFSQGLVAEKASLKFDVRTLRAIENGKQKPNHDSLEFIINALEITPEELLEEVNKYRESKAYNENDELYMKESGVASLNEIKAPGIISKDRNPGIDYSGMFYSGDVSNSDANVKPKELVDRDTGKASPELIAHMDNELCKTVGKSFAEREERHTRDRRIPLCKLHEQLIKKILGIDFGKRTTLTKIELVVLSEIVQALIHPSIIEPFSEISFQNKFWTENVLTRQPDKIKIHLHLANNFMGEVITDDLSRILRGPPCNKRSVQLLEAGTGGCNTTISIIKRLLGNDPLIPTESLDVSCIRYHGIEINNKFAGIGNDLFGQNRPPDNDPDTRDEILSGERVQLWDGKKNFIASGDAYREIKTLSEASCYAGTVNYFFSSFMLHHIPNGDGLLKLIFGSENNYLQRFFGTERISDAPEKFVEELKKFLSDSSITIGDIDLDNFSMNRLLEVSAFGLAEYVRDKIYGNLSEIDLFCKDVLHFLNMRKRGYTSKEYGPDIIPAFFTDMQLELLRSIWILLENNGLILIADPDGTSKFNAKNVGIIDTEDEKNMIGAEMAVAHFRTKERMVWALEEVGFSVEIVETIISRENRNAREEDEKEIYELINNDRDLKNFGAEIIDDNLGYIIVARKCDET